MTINEIKGLTKFLDNEDVENIKKQIKDKEEILKSGKLDEEEMVQVLNSLFAILVIEKTLESQIEGVEEIRDQLESELLEAYEVYDSYMVKYKKEEKKKKKGWLLRFLSLSDIIHDKKESIGGANKAITEMKKDLKNLKEKRSDDNLKNVANKCNHDLDDFCHCHEECKNPLHYTHGKHLGNNHHRKPKDGPIVPEEKRKDTEKETKVENSEPKKISGTSHRFKVGL